LKTPKIDKIRLNQGFMLIEEKKEAHRGPKLVIGGSQASYMTWVKLKLLCQEILFNPVVG